MNALKNQEVNDMIQSPFGHWVVADKIYYNKLQAVADAAPRGWWPHFYFHEDQFGRVDWQKQPTESLEQLYNARAQQLRKKYDHITVEFSGGADSWYAMHSFMRQGLHVDAVYHKYVDASSGDVTDLNPDNQHAEAKFQAFPWFKKWQELDPNITWEVEYVTDTVIKGWSNVPVDPLEYNGVNVGLMFKLPGISGDLPKFMPIEKNCAVVYGTDKPNLFFENGTFYLYFPENPVVYRAYIERKRMGIPVTDVMFYWDPDCCALLAKQAHIVMNWFKKNPKMLPLISNRKYRDTNLYYSIVNALIYPDYDPDWQSEKGTGRFNQTHETWFHKNSEGTVHGTNWHKTMKRMHEVMTDCVAGTEFDDYIHRENQYNVLSDQWSKFYKIGSL